MSQLLNIKNFNSANILAQTKLNGDVAAASSSLTVFNTDDFVAGTILIGSPGSQSAELGTITAPSNATTVPLSANTGLPHNNGDPVYMLFGSQVRIYRAADQYGTGQQPDDANFTLVATVDIDGGKELTSYTDNGGSSGDWYKFTYYNSSSGAETSLVDARAAQAGQVHYVSLDQVRRAAGLQDNSNITDDMVSEFRDAAEKEVNGALLPVYNFPLPQPTNPIVVEITKNIAAGELKHEAYQNVSETMSKEGATKADKARHGGGSHTSLDELVAREVVLMDATFTELTVDEGHAFGGWPDDTTSLNNEPSQNDQGYDNGPQFTMDKEY